MHGLILFELIYFEFANFFFVLIAEASDLLQKMSLDSQPKALEEPVASKKVCVSLMCGDLLIF